MAVITKQLLLLAVLSFSMFGRSLAQDATQPAAEENGTLIVLVTWGDINNTPANDVYIEAYTSSAKVHDRSTYILTQVRPGHYESSLPPGVYDVFVSEGNSVPRCKRVLILPKKQNCWTLKLEDDEVYTSK